MSASAEEDSPPLILAEVVELPLDIEPYEPPPTRLGVAWQRFESGMERAGERLNPILVKEARQALKSKQFTITFALVLAAAWVVSFLGLAIMGPQVYFGGAGSGLLFGYFVILIAALLVIVPYGAFRSLAGELEDRTYELLSITTLKARQIIGGKLAVAILQMVVYLSAISPCIAFTYLLRGVDVLSILLLVYYAVLSSLGLSLIGLLLATCAAEKYQQVVVSVLFVLVLLGAFWIACALGAEIVTEIVPLDLFDFWLVNLAILAAFASYFAILYLAAAAMLSFPGSNRSTSVRWAMVAQQALFAGWMAYVWVRDVRRPEYLVVFLVCSAVSWYAMGTFLTGESPVLSPRVKRDLPQSFLGRSLLTWFNPGPGTGYLFVLGNFLAMWLLALLGVVFRGLPSTFPSGTLPAVEMVLGAGLLLLSYLTIYLGLGKLLLSLARRAAPVGVVLRVAIHLLLLAAGSLIPAAIQWSFDGIGTSGYSLLQMSNPFWTIVEAVQPGRKLPDLPALLLILPAIALIVFFANLPGVVAEVRQVRISKPARVVEEDATAQAPAV